MNMVHFLARQYADVASIMHTVTCGTTSESPASGGTVLAKRVYGVGTYSIAGLVPCHEAFLCIP